MGSMTRAPISGVSLPGEPRPTLVTFLAGIWLLFAVTAAIQAVLALANGPATAEGRLFAALSLLFAALFGTGAVGLLRREAWARTLLATAGVLALSVSAFGAFRRVEQAAAPAVALAPTEPDAANALALFRAGSAIAFLLAAIPLVLALSLLRHSTVRDWANPGLRASAGGRRPDALLVAVGGAVLVAGLSFFLSRKSSSPVVSGRQAQRVALAPAEAFLWSDQPIAFGIPKEPFTRERHAEGGQRGVSFTRYQVPPTRMTVAEAFFDSAPNTIEEVLAKKRLSNLSFPSADSVEVGDPAPATVGGAPAFQTDYTMRERGMNHVGRELVALSGRHVFVFTFLGRPSDLPVFEALLASAAFPPPGGPEGTVRTAQGADSAAAGAGTTEIRVGEHRVLVSVPAGFERVDYGSKQEFRSDETRIALVDGGELPPETGAVNLEDDWLVHRALRLFEHDMRRWEVGAKTRITVGDRDALVVDTREPLSHAFHKRTVVFVNGRRLLAGGMVMGLPETSCAALDALARSVRFPP